MQVVDTQDHRTQSCTISQPFRQKKINVWEQPDLLFVEQKARPGLISCCPSKLWFSEGSHFKLQM